MSNFRDQLVEIVEDRGLLRLPEPVKLASGEYSREFVDAKHALCRGDDLALACRLVLSTLGDAGIEFDAAGGLTMGADQFAHGLAVIGHKEWFVVRKAAKGRGTDRRVEGTKLGSSTRVVLIDDVVTTGGSIQEAFWAVGNEGSPQIVAAVTLVDRGERARSFFMEQKVPYFPLITYRDLGIGPVGQELPGALEAPVNP